MKFETYVLFFDIISKSEEEKVGWNLKKKKNKGCNWKNHRQFFKC